MNEGEENSLNSKNVEKSEKIITIKKETIQRLIKDVKQLKKYPLHENNIYYLHDEENILKGYALIIGGVDTPYFGGYYFFELNYPQDYPHSPPKVVFVTNGDNIRFNPNLYTNGKVCISLLNTWRGDQWTSCQTISSVLLTLGTLLCKNPLLNEPGITRQHRDFNNYTKIIEYKNIEIAIIAILNKYPKKYYDKYSFIHLFDSIVQEKYIENRLKILQFIQEKINNPIEHLRTHLYNLNVVVDYDYLLKKFTSVSVSHEEKDI
jgi:ubiquitin-conjugating enzyme E2 Z